MLPATVDLVLLDAGALVGWGEPVVACRVADSGGLVGAGKVVGSGESVVVEGASYLQRALVQRLGLVAAKDREQLGSGLTGSGTVSYLHCLLVRHLVPVAEEGRELADSERLYDWMGLSRVLVCWHVAESRRCGCSLHYWHEKCEFSLNPKELISKIDLLLKEQEGPDFDAELVGHPTNDFFLNR